MLTKSSFKSVYSRCFSSGIVIPRFTNLHNATQKINTDRPGRSVILITEDWHPLTEKAREDFRRLAAETSDFNFYEIDASQDQRAVKFYNSKATPSYVFCAFGLEYRKQIGVNYNSLQELLSKTRAAQTDEGIPDHHRKYYPFEEAWNQLRTWEEESNLWAETL